MSEGRTARFDIRAWPKLRLGVFIVAMVETAFWVGAMIAGNVWSIDVTGGSYGQQSAALANQVFGLFVLPALVLSGVGWGVIPAAVLAGIAAMLYVFPYIFFVQTQLILIAAAIATAGYIIMRMFRKN
jgi:hypothetical protein